MIFTNVYCASWGWLNCATPTATLLLHRPKMLWPMGPSLRQQFPIGRLTISSVNLFKTQSKSQSTVHSIVQSMSPVQTPAFYKDQVQLRYIATSANKIMLWFVWGSLLWYDNHQRVTQWVTQWLSLILSQDLLALLLTGFNLHTVTVPCKLWKRASISP